MANSDKNATLHYFFFLLMSTLATFFVRFLIKTFTNNPDSTVRHPPSPPALPIIGHLHLVGSRLPISFQTLARLYGPLMQIRLGSTSFVVASNAAVAKDIFKTHDINFASRFEFGATEYNIYKGLGFITGPYGTYWRFMRKLCMTKLFAGSQIERFNCIREQEVTKLLKSLMRCSKEGEACDLSVELENLTNNLICKMAMRKRFEKHDNEAKEMRRLVVNIMDSAAKMGINEVFGILKKIDLFGNGRKIKEELWRYDGLIEEIMRDYETNLENGGDKDEGEKDVMDILLETHRDPDAEVKISKNQIKLFIMELFMASIDTSTAAIQWTMAELINRPEVFKKLRDQIESVVGPASRLVKESDVPRLPYLQAAVKESLRLHTPAPIIHRECIKDCKINGFDVKDKTKLLINAYAIMRDPDTWHDPEEYIPERFLVGSCCPADGCDEMNGHHGFSFIPFGGGRRGCMGNTHAYTVMYATVGALVQCFDWKLKGGEKAEIDVAAGFSGAMAPSLVCCPITHFNPF